MSTLFIIGACQPFPCVHRGVPRVLYQQKLVRSSLIGRLCSSNRAPLHNPPQNLFPTAQKAPPSSPVLPLPRLQLVVLQGDVCVRLCRAARAASLHMRSQRCTRAPAPGMPVSNRSDSRSPRPPHAPRGEEADSTRPGSATRRECQMLMSQPLHPPHRVGAGWVWCGIETRVGVVDAVATDSSCLLKHSTRPVCKPTSSASAFGGRLADRLLRFLHGLSQPVGQQTGSHGAEVLLGKKVVSE